MVITVIGSGAAVVIVGLAAIWWLRVGLRRARRTHFAWRVEHGWKCAHLLARPGGDRLLDWWLAALLVPLGPLAPLCRRQRVLIGLHLLLLVIFGAAPAVTRPPTALPAAIPRPAIYISPILPGSDMPLQKA